MWKKHDNYDETKDCEYCIYVLKRGRNPVYIGKAKVFGGKKGRYAYGYKYLIKLLLDNGYKLYTWKIRKDRWSNYKNYEITLIEKYPRVENKKRKRPVGFRRIKYPPFLEIRVKRSKGGIRG